MHGGDGKVEVSLRCADGILQCLRVGSGRKEDGFDVPVEEEENAMGRCYWSKHVGPVGFSLSNKLYHEHVSSLPFCGSLILDASPHVHLLRHADHAISASMTLWSN
jgi:hypothetical protein